MAAVVWLSCLPLLLTPPHLASALLAPQELEIYRLHLALTVSATPVQGRRFLPADCEPGVQFQPQDVKALLRLSDLGLIDDVVSMARYVNLRKLNLSGNRIRDLSRLGLDALPHLRILDVSRNDIRMSLPDLGAWLNGREALQVFAIRKNPCVKSYEVSRLHLIGCIDRMRQVRARAHPRDFAAPADSRGPATDHVRPACH